MQLSSILSLLGSTLIVAGIVLHIVCLSTPHYVGTDTSGMEAKLKAVVDKSIPAGTDPSIKSKIEADFHESMQKSGMFAQGDMYYGLWKLCIDGEEGFDFCAKWASKTSFTSLKDASFKVPSWIQGAQAMAILGLLAAVAAGVLTAVHLFVPSRGDRLRLLPVFICVTSMAAGAIVLCGDIIIAAKYEKVFVSTFGNETEMPPKDILSVLESIFFLSWGFALDLVAAAFLFLAGLFFIFAGRTSSEAGGLI